MQQRVMWHITQRVAGWHVASQHTMARTRWMLQQQQSIRKGKVVACKRKGDRKKKVKLPRNVIFSWQYLNILPFALPADYDWTLHGAGPVRDSHWGPRPVPVGSSTCPGKQYFSPDIYIFTGLFTFLLTVDIWMERRTSFSSSFFLPARLCQH